MKVSVLYRPKSDTSRAVDTFVHDFQVRNPATKVELLNVDGRDALALASLYDIMQFPAIMVTAIDGSLLGVWQGKQLPLINEVAACLGNGW